MLFCYEIKGGTKPLYYTYCPHGNSYQFRHNSSLRKYLEKNCKGWVRNSVDRYTLNYVILVLVCALKEKGLVRKTVIYCDTELREIFDTDCVLVHLLRSKVREHFLHNEFPTRNDYFPFWCVPGYEELILDVFEKPVLYTGVPFKHFCKKL